MANQLIDAKTASAILGYKNVKVFNTNRKQNNGFPQPKRKALNSRCFLYSREEIEAYAKLKEQREAKTKKRNPTAKAKGPSGIDNELARSFLFRGSVLG